MNHSEFSTIYVLTKKMNGEPSPSFGFKHRGRAKLFTLAIIDRELEATSLPNHFTLTLEEIQYSEEA